MSAPFRAAGPVGGTSVLDRFPHGSTDRLLALYAHPPSLRLTSYDYIEQLVGNV
jgi:hypothetical protein